MKYTLYENKKQIKDKHISFLVLFVWMIFIQKIYGNETCGEGMRKMYLNETTSYNEGTATNVVPAIITFVGDGALWYKRRVLIEPRFEVYLKAAIKSTNVTALKGFTIVISGNKNTLQLGPSDYMGYYGFTKSYIIEFDFNKGNHDPDDSSFSFRFCDKDCSNDDSHAILSGKLSRQIYDPTRDMDWHFKLIYSDKKLSLYHLDDTVIFTHNVDLNATLETYAAFVGFTGYKTEKKGELNVSGTFICEDNFDISKMRGKFYVNKKEYEKYIFESGENFQYLFSFINIRGQIVPHCFGLGIWNYNFSLSLDCIASNYNITMKDEYSLLLSMNACCEEGPHNLSIFESSNGIGPELFYIIKASTNSTLNNACKFNNISHPIFTDTNTTYENCIDYFYNITINNSNSNNTNNIIMNIQNAIVTHKLDKCIDKIIIKENKDLLFKYNKIIYQLTSSYNQNHNIYNNLSIIKFDKYEKTLRILSPKDKKYNLYNLSSINLGECEEQLRKNFNYDNNITLLLLKLDIIENGFLIPIIEYEAYNSSTKEQIELNICKNIKINLNIPVIIDENNIFQYNSSNNYYNDICYSYTKNNADIILKDRRDEYINNNLSLCEKDCEFTNYDYKTKKVLCQCFTKIKIPLLSEIVINKDRLLRNFIDIKSILNIDVLKCFKEAFDKKRLILNLGFIIMGIIILITLVLSILFKIKGYPNLKNKIYEIFNNKKQKEKEKENENENKKENKIENKNENVIIKNNIKNNPNKKGERKINLVLENDEKNSGSEKNSKAGMIKIYETKLIDINNNISNKINYNDYELNDLSYNEALEIDKRIYFQYYLSLLKMKHILIFAFYTNTDYNSKLIKIILFLFSFSIYFTINALFFSDTTIHQIYEDKGEYNFIYQIPIILYSTIISSFINIIVKYLSLTESNIIKIKKKENTEKINEFFNYLFIKLIIFFILISLFLLLFWFYLVCFCGIYQNSQIHLIKDTLSSFGLSLLYPFILILLPGILRIPSIKNKNKECLFKISKILQLI